MSFLLQTGYEKKEGSGLMQPYLRVFHPSAVLSPPRGGLLPIEPRRFSLEAEGGS